MDLQPLKFLRKKITDIDFQIIKLLKERKKISIKIIQKKISKKIPIVDIKREKSLIELLIKFSKKCNLNFKKIEKIFHIIMEYSKEIQQKYFKKIKTKNEKIKTCAYLGPKGSYSDICFNILKNIKQKNINKKRYSCFKEIIKSVQNKTNDYALVPLENNNTGIISDILNLCEKKKIFIHKEINMKVNHSLLSLKDTFFNEIKYVYSHKQPIKQCNKFLSHFPWKIVYTNSSSEAMNILKEKKKKNIVTIGNDYSKKYYNLITLIKNISNIKNNFTKFVILKNHKKNNENEKKTKTIILIIFKKNHKYLAEILISLRKNNILIKKCLFYKNYKNKKLKNIFLEIESNIKTKKIKKYIFNHLKHIKHIQNLGCYQNNEKLSLV